jgi:arylsulfatase A-like enzyme
MEKTERHPWKSRLCAVLIASAAGVGLVALNSKELVSVDLSVPQLRRTLLQNSESVEQKQTLDESIEDSTSTEKTQPHIVLFTVDDLGWNDVGYNSNDLPDATPYMTDLSTKGIRFTSYYAQPSCTPSRVAIMTGKFPYRNGFQNYELQHQDSAGVPLSNKFMPEYLKELGYKTVGFGKWNIGHCSSMYLPSDRGFEHFIGYSCPGHGYTTHNCGMDAQIRDMFETWAATDTERSRWQTGLQYHGTYDTLLYRDKANAALRAHAANHPSSPLFLWSAQHGIHSEWDSDPVPPKELLTEDNLRYLKELRLNLNEDNTDEFSRFFKMRMITASVLMSIDNSLKSLVETLENLDMFKDTVLVVHSDNGGDTLYTMGHPGNNYPLRSEKFGYYEGGVRVPAFMVAPSLIPASRVGVPYKGLMHHVDLLATFIGLAGGDTEALVTSEGMDSLDHWSAIIGDTLSPRSELVLNLPRTKTWKVGETETQQGIALRKGNYKLLVYHPFDSWFNPLPNHKLNNAPNMLTSVCKFEFYTVRQEDACTYGNYLFDLSLDPFEEHNLWELPEYADVKKSLINRAEQLIAEQSDYGKILVEFVQQHPRPVNSYYEGNDWYIVPWQCEVIP